MAPGSLPPISNVPNLSTAERASILDQLFEPSIPLHTLSLELLQIEHFTSYEDMIASIGLQLTDLAESGLSSDTELLGEILQSHPRLGEKGVASDQSRGEQAQLNTGKNSDGIDLMERNAEYERTFPGLKYLVFVNGRNRSTIVDDIQTRIRRRNISLERREAIKAMCEIAADRARKLVLVS